MVKIILLFDAILRHQLLRVGIILWHAGGGDCLVQREELGEQIAFGIESVGGEDGGVERGVGVAQRIRAGQFQRGPGFL